MPDGAYNLLFITATHFRADHVSSFGHPFVNTRHLDRLAREGVRFPQCYAASPLTGPAGISLMTGTYPAEHQHLEESSRMSPLVPNLAGELKKAGFATGVFGSNVAFQPAGLNAMFDEIDGVGEFPRPAQMKGRKLYEPFIRDDESSSRGPLLVGEAMEFINRVRGQKRPFFLWLSLDLTEPPFGVPQPYDSLFPAEKCSLPPGWAQTDLALEPRRCEVWRHSAGLRQAKPEQVKAAQAAYLGLIRQVDDLVGRMTSHLESVNLLEDTIISFSGITGEPAGHRGLFHRLPLFYDPLVRVPWILRFPDSRWRSQVFNGLVEQVDIAPTILDALSLGTPPTMVGASWVNDLDSDQDQGKSSVLCEGGFGAPTQLSADPAQNRLYPARDAFGGPGVMVRSDNFKLVLYADDQGELFDLEDDKHELKNLFANPAFAEIRESLTREAMVRRLLVKNRPIRGAWPHLLQAADSRSYPLETRSKPAVPMADEVGPLKLVPVPGLLPVHGLFGDGKGSSFRRKRVTSAPIVLKKPVGRSSSPSSPVRKSAPRSFSHVLFVCTGNYYRSRFAEAYFNYFAELLNLRHIGQSRGLDISRIQGEVSPIVLAALAERDVPDRYAEVDRKSLTLDDLKRADRVICLDDAEHREMMRKKFSDWADRVEYWKARDVDHAKPEETLHLIESHVVELVRELDRAAI